MMEAEMNLLPSGIGRKGLANRHVVWFSDVTGIQSGCWHYEKSPNKVEMKV